MSNLTAPVSVLSTTRKTIYYRLETLTCNTRSCVNNAETLGIHLVSDIISLILKLHGKQIKTTNVIRV